MSLLKFICLASFLSLHAFARHLISTGGMTRYPHPKADPNEEPECQKWVGKIDSFDMTMLTDRWYWFYGTGDPEGYMAGYGGDTFTIQTGINVPPHAKTNIFLLEIVHPNGDVLDQIPYVVGWNSHCIAHHVRDINKESEKGLDVNVYVQSV